MREIVSVGVRWERVSVGVSMGDSECGRERVSFGERVSVGE